MACHVGVDAFVVDEAAAVVHTVAPAVVHTNAVVVTDVAGDMVVEDTVGVSVNYNCCCYDSKSNDTDTGSYAAAIA